MECFASGTWPSRPVLRSSDVMEVIKGIPVAPGVAIGNALILEDIRHRVAHHVVSSNDVAQELASLEEAHAQAQAGLQRDRDQAAATLGEEPAKIFEFHLGLLADASLIDPIRLRISDEQLTAASAVAAAFTELADKFRAMGSDVFRQKANDIVDLERRLLGHLVGRTLDRLSKIESPVLLVSHDMTPTQVAMLDTTKVLGIGTDLGGRTSHASIVAAAMGVPVVVGTQSITEHVDEGDLTIIDGKTGVVIIRPDAETLEKYTQRAARQASIRAEVRGLAELEAVTRCGERITLLGNVEFPHEIARVLEEGGEGVGLFRTEFQYLASKTEPTEEELYETYRLSAETLNGCTLTLRTLDLGADKHTQHQAEEPERNPFLGLRSIRYCLQNLPLFRTQLRAILRASAHGNVKVMFPLVTTMLELRQARMILEDVMEELAEDGIDFDREIPVGIMIEVPSAALMAASFAREVSFFSIGTNDLVQYTLAVDRGNERVANLYAATNPAVLKLVKAVLRAGKRFDVETSLCGEIAGDVTYTMLLIGLGLRTLSLVPTQIPDVKRVIRSVDVAQCERLARRVGSFDSERRIMRCLREELREVLPDLDGGWSTGG